MKFEEVESGMLFRQDIGGEYGTKFWFVYYKTSDRFISLMFFTNKSSGKRLVEVTVTKDVYENPDYIWSKRKPVSIDDLMRYKKKLIPAIFEEL